MSQDVPAAGVGQGGAETVIRKTVASYAYRRSVYEVHQEFAEVHPEQIGAACTGWKAAADELLALAEDLKARIAVPLADAWSSPSSPQAQVQLQQAEATARALAAECLQMARATDSAAQYARWYKANLPSYVEAVATATKGAATGKGLTAGAEEAVDHMVKLLHCYNEVIQTLPAAVRSPVPMVADGGKDDSFTRRVPGAQGGGASGAGGVGAAGVGRVGVGSGAGSPAVTGSGLAGAVGSAGVGAAQGSGGDGAAWGPGVGSDGVSGAGVSVDPYAAGSSLAGTGLGGGVSGLDPAALGSAVGGAGSGLGGLGDGLGAGALGATGLGAGGLAAGLGSGRAGTGLGTGAGAGSGVFGGPGAGGAGTGGVVGQSGSASGAGRGAGMVPMHGAGGGGEGEEERQRSSWLTEDDDVWGVDEGAPPPVITE
jgi:hypothetical protein